MKHIYPGSHFYPQRTISPLLFVVFISSVLFTFFPATSVAQGNLMITPRRIVFEGQRRTQELNLANSGKDTARYVISLIDIRMKENGTFEQITVPDSGQYFASSNVRFFPRSVTLGPGEVQSVKIQVIKPNQLTAGEYRSHIYLRAIPPVRPLGEKDSAQQDASLSIQLVPVFGISIPIIIRTSAARSTTHFSSTVFEMVNDTVPVLTMILNRSGEQSVYGDITVDFISPQGKTNRVSEMKGIAVYTPTSGRRIRLELDTKQGIHYNTGKLRMIYKASSDDKPAQMAEYELSLL